MLPKWSRSLGPSSLQLVISQPSNISLPPTHPTSLVLAITGGRVFSFPVKSQFCDMRYDHVTSPGWLSDGKMAINGVTEWRDVSPTSFLSEKGGWTKSLLHFLSCLLTVGVLIHAHNVSCSSQFWFCPVISLPCLKIAFSLYSESP